MALYKFDFMLCYVMMRANAAKCGNTAASRSFLLQTKLVDQCFFHEKWSYENSHKNVQYFDARNGN